jgi:hypothetical protein
MAGSAPKYTTAMRADAAALVRSKSSRICVSATDLIDTS